jgi:hypothetical protein
VEATWDVPIIGGCPNVKEGVAGVGERAGNADLAAEGVGGAGDCDAPITGGIDPAGAGEADNADAGAGAIGRGGAGAIGRGGAVVGAGEGEGVGRRAGPVDAAR